LTLIQPPQQQPSERQTMAAATAAENADIALAAPCRQPLLPMTLLPRRPPPMACRAAAEMFFTPRACCCGGEPARVYAPPPLTLPRDAVFHATASADAVFSFDSCASDATTLR